jgi:hypothetical protein
MKRIIYLIYYFKKLDKEKFRKFFKHTIVKYRIKGYKLLTDVLVSSLKYNVSILEYFQFGFYNLGKSLRMTYAGTGYMYEYQLIMNPPEERVILDDKTLFYRNYGKFIKHKVADIKDLQTFPVIADEIINNPANKIVFKIFNGKCGQQVMIKDAEEFKKNDLIKFMHDNELDLAEEFIIQHPSLMALSPSAVNTVRIFTQLNSRNEVEILGCRLRISINSVVDNMAAGNVAAVINEETGVIIGPGVYSDITKQDEVVHPVTGIPIIGFCIPFWDETISIVKEAALMHQQNRSIGWDIAITKNGPDLIEGNHDWCKLVWQLPVKRGLKAMLERHLLEYRNFQKQSC